MKRPADILALFAVIVVAAWAITYFPDRPFSTHIDNDSPVAALTEVVNLKDGDEYPLIAGVVRKTIAGHEVKMLAYNGMIPGPIIKVPKNAEVTFHFTNNIEMETTLHSHGVRVDNAFDGTPHVTQPPIKVGESFDYKIRFPDEGVYWYHPHIREDYAQELGLYGNYIVASDDPNYWAPVNEEIPLIVDDILFEDGKIAPFSDVTDHALMGRFGNVMLANGSDAFSHDVQQGAVVRLFLTNAANTRTFKLQIPGAELKLVGADSGRYERETVVTAVLIAPSERAIVDVYFPETGTFKLQNNTPAATSDIATFVVTASEVETSYVAQFRKLRETSVIRTAIPNIEEYFTKEPDKNIALDMSYGDGRMDMSSGDHEVTTTEAPSHEHMHHDKIEWEDTMNETNRETGANEVVWNVIDMNTDRRVDESWTFKKGDLVKMRILNKPDGVHPMQHPMHLHGQRFLILATNGVKNTNLAWKDTTLVQTGDTVDILIEMSNPGKWMAHCHIAEHLEAGMMFDFTVLP